MDANFKNYLFIFGCAGSSQLHIGLFFFFFQLQLVGAIL